ncbi:MAG: septum formation initiator family protein [Candidatus Omnitrophica bacterium]|nr:septum formation initiator family protein [Candidatus Omnitrophota bacterium]
MLPIIKKAFWFLGFGIFLLIVFFPGYTKVQELKEKNRDLESKAKELKIENVLLQEELKRIEHDPLYQEKLAREKMGVVRKGEIPVRIIPERER